MCNIRKNGKPNQYAIDNIYESVNFCILFKYERGEEAVEWLEEKSRNRMGGQSGTLIKIILEDKERVLRYGQELDIQCKPLKIKEGGCTRTKTLCFSFIEGYEALKWIQTYGEDFKYGKHSYIVSLLLKDRIYYI